MTDAKNSPGLLRVWRWIPAIFDHDARPTRLFKMLFNQRRTPGNLLAAHSRSVPCCHRRTTVKSRHPYREDHRLTQLNHLQPRCHGSPLPCSRPPRISPQCRRLIPTCLTTMTSPTMFSTPHSALLRCPGRTAPSKPPTAALVLSRNAREMKETNSPATPPADFYVLPADHLHTRSSDEEDLIRDQAVYYSEIGEQQRQQSMRRRAADRRSPELLSVSGVCVCVCVRACVCACFWVLTYLCFVLRFEALSFAIHQGK